ncbi:MAG: cytochrome c-type biogenesis CcmF C-terminal domain-containing protein [Acidimicrobiales bacterium]|jgi:cytochrome c-type biogenesis protein CcmF|nr:cytochrome c-type biogenesis CcmF C-terminal domain-containing protein [Acidimicrobiales bacterium]MDP6648977.1 cytochrome c-type biogenesis CcmF C-terminal domain-containing protein [Acidimicrobiales bacterium]MDP6760714.1 cytochrome c-type biogenesis CcmF C-terminal domain-containing protein [Acidimicrobiales bacterium]|tara:strand:- start:1689 stop:3650 length:1962 start_codon:yes stop_codon:yes gene_type:complete
MNATLGSGFVALGLTVSLLGVLNTVRGLATRSAVHLARTRWYVAAVAVAAVGQFAVMERALITRDFTMAFVAQHGSHRTPALFNVATLWSVLEGSILLWVLILVGYLVLVACRFRDRLTDPMVGWVLLVMLVACTFFFLLLAGPAHPFGRFDPWPGFDGPGPNPLLQNHVLMAFHPPVLYLGYVGFTVPFAFAVASLATGRLGEGWLLETRRWTLLAWGCLTVGILLGAWWSYEVLGWGGYWAWDPVENASLLPWLTGTAYLHSVMVQERRGMLRVWNLSLLCSTFALTILGTFLTRSGVVESVHSFTESGIGPMFLAFFAVIVATAVGLVAWRGDDLRAEGSIDSPVSRTGAFLANNLLFGAFAFVVLLGTMFPLLIETINGNRISVGNPYFDRMTMPIGFLLLFLMAVAPALPWGRAGTEVLAKRLQWPVVAGVAAMVVAVALGGRGWATVLAVGLAGFASGGAVRQLALAVHSRGLRGFVGRSSGGMIVHIGVAIVAVALACSSSYVRQAEVGFMEPGDRSMFAGHELVFDGLERVELAEKNEMRVRVLVDGDLFTPAITYFPFAGQTIGTPTTRSTWRDDLQLYVLSVPEKEGDATKVWVTVQPLVWWLWYGGGVMAFGTLLAAVPDRRRRRDEEPVERAAAADVEVPK